MSIPSLVLVVLLALLPLGPARAAADALVLRDEVGAFDAWDVVTVLDDPSGALQLEDVRRQVAAFRPAGPLQANLGRRAGAVWLRIPLEVPAGRSGHWVLDIDYASLDRIDVYRFDAQGGLEQTVRLGDHVAWADRVVPARSHVLMLDLPPGKRRELLLRVQTGGSMLVPIRFSTPERFLQEESKEQALQGLIAGAGLVLLIYSLSQWRSLRDAMFGWYALSLLGTTAFFAALSGVGTQHVWGRFEWMALNAPPFTILVGVCGALFFVLRALDVARNSPRVAWAVRLCGVVAGAAAVLFPLGLLTYGTAQAIGMSLAPAPLLLVLPTAFRLARGGDVAARWLLVGWGTYSIGVLMIVSVLNGWAPANYWTLHLFQFASLLEMTTWMMVLAGRVRTIRDEAAQVRSEHDRLRSQALTDGLTGVLNRRGLVEALRQRVPDTMAAGRSMALYLVDLDGFKPVNDTLGHGAGDQLLVAVAQRLRSLVRASDLVGRLGGDEFVLAVGPLSDAAEDEAQQIGHKLLRGFEQPFVIDGDRICRVGLTIGYVLAPQDGTDLAELLKQADEAMYLGKQAGRHCLRRGGGGSASAGAVRLS